MLERAKELLRDVPGVRSLIVRFRDEPFSNSSDYWKRRYKAGGTSGAGSYGRLAVYKAQFLNDFVDRHGIASVIEYGCGDGAQLKRASYPLYTGIDVSPEAIESCRTLFAQDRTKSFFHVDEPAAHDRADLVLSLDVIYHLIEDSVFEDYMHQIFDAATRFVIIYSSDKDSAWSAKHVRHRKFTAWVAENRADWNLLETEKNPYPYDETDTENTSFAQFHVFGRGH